MAKKNDGKAKCLLLMDGPHGKCGQVVELDSAEVAGLVEAGEADDSAAAIAAYQ